MISDLGRLVIHLTAISLISAGSAHRTVRQIVGTAYEHQREARIRHVYEPVVELDERGVDIDVIAGRPACVTAVHGASRIAMGEHTEEKLDMLEAVVFTAATRETAEVADLGILRYRGGLTSSNRSTSPCSAAAWILGAG